MIRELCLASGVCLLADAALGILPASTVIRKRLFGLVGGGLVVVPRIV